MNKTEVKESKKVQLEMTIENDDFEKCLNEFIEIAVNTGIVNISKINLTMNILKPDNLETRPIHEMDKKMEDMFLVSTKEFFKTFGVGINQIQVGIVLLKEKYGVNYTLHISENGVLAEKERITSNTE